MENIKWTTWTVPERFVWKYMSLIVLVLYVLPYLFALKLTMFGYALNLLWADFMFFSWYKAKIKSEKYFEIQIKNETRKKRADLLIAEASINNVIGILNAPEEIVNILKGMGVKPAVKIIINPYV